MRNLRECAITAQIFFLRSVEQRSDSAAIFAQQLRKLCCNCSLIEDSIVLFSPFLRWFINEKKVIGDYTTEMIIHNATRDLHDAIVKCEVHNDVGKSEDTETLDITCEYKKARVESILNRKKERGFRIRKNGLARIVHRFFARKYGVNIR